MPQPDDFATWQAQFATERLHLLDAFGELTAGGIVEGIQHIGATSIPDMTAAPCVDIGLAVWPFPLEAGHQAKLQLLGYLPITGYEAAPEQRFRHTSRNFQLFVTEGGSDEWTNYLLIRDYLRDTESARRIFSRFKQSCHADAPEYQQGKARLFSEILPAAQMWWIDTQGFAPVEAVAQELKEYQAPWSISSGWAIDLFVGRVTRVHHDVDVVICYDDQLALRQHLSDRHWTLMTPYEGRLEPWPPDMLLESPRRHQVHAHRDGAFIDFLLSDLSNGLWRYRRDPKVVRQLDRAILSSAHGVQFLAPELVLLFKSKNTAANGRARPQDQSDFEAVIAHLEPERRAWLRWALIAKEPAHPWIDQLG